VKPSLLKSVTLEKIGGGGGGGDPVGDPVGGGGGDPVGGGWA